MLSKIGGIIMTDNEKKPTKKVEELLKSADAGEWKRVLHLAPEKPKKPPESDSK